MKNSLNNNIITEIILDNYMRENPITAMIIVTWRNYITEISFRFIQNHLKLPSFKELEYLKQQITTMHAYEQQVLVCLYVNRYFLSLHFYYACITIFVVYLQYSKQISFMILVGILLQIPKHFCIVFFSLNFYSMSYLFMSYERHAQYKSQNCNCI